MSIREFRIARKASAAGRYLYLSAVTARQRQNEMSELIHSSPLNLKITDINSRVGEKDEQPNFARRSHPS